LKGRRGEGEQGDKVSGEEAATERSDFAQLLFRFTVFLLGLHSGNYSHSLADLNSIGLSTSGGLHFQSDLQSDTAMTPSGFLPLFALISLTSRERRERILTGHPHK
jgi:hypothetical protein